MIDKKETQMVKLETRAGVIAGWVFFIYFLDQSILDQNLKYLLFSFVALFHLIIARWADDLHVKLEQNRKWTEVTFYALELRNMKDELGSAWGEYNNHRKDELETEETEERINKLVGGSFFESRAWLIILSIGMKTLAIIFGLALLGLFGPIL